MNTFDNAKQREYFEALTGIDFRVRRPQELAFVLWLRPFNEARVLKRKVIFGGNVHKQALRAIKNSRAAPRVVFIGLECPGARVQRRGLIEWIGGIFGSSPRLIATSEELNRISTWLKQRRELPAHCFFEASNELWQEAVKCFADLAAAIIVDTAGDGDGLRWEAEHILTRHPGKVVAWPVNSVESRVPLPKEVKAHPVMTASGREIVDRVFPALLAPLKQYDSEVSQAVLKTALADMPWAEKFHAGVRAIGESVPEAERLLAEAWQTGGNSGVLSIYPTLAYLDVLATTGNASGRNALISAVFDWYERERPELGFERAKKKWSDVSTSNKQHSVDAAMFTSKAMRMLLTHLEISDGLLPLAIWQFRATLGDGINNILQLEGRLPGLFVPILPSLVDYQERRAVTVNWTEQLNILRDQSTAYREAADPQLIWLQAWHCRKIALELGETRVVGFVCLAGVEATWVLGEHAAALEFCDHGLAAAATEDPHRTALAAIRPVIEREYAFLKTATPP